jgi:hypothetical protein
VDDIVGVALGDEVPIVVGAGGAEPPPPPHAASKTAALVNTKKKRTLKPHTRRERGAHPGGHDIAYGQ